MITELIKAFVIGICAAVPVGPVLLMVIQKTLCRGRSAGMMTGFGSALADTVYAAVGLFTLTLIEGFVEKHAAPIMIAGGVLIAAIGLGIVRHSSLIDLSDKDSGAKGTFSLLGCSLQSLGSALSNPAALAMMLGLLAVGGFASGRPDAPLWALLLAVFAGEFLYWIAVVLLLSTFVKPSGRVLRIMSRVAGIAICCFALVLTVRGIIML